MKIAACLGVKDEVELIAPMLAHLASIGVEHVVARDARSTDGSAELLAEAERAGGLDLVSYDDQDPDPDAYVRRVQLCMDRARAAGADWMLFCDADEFWLPATGRLQDCRAFQQVDILNVPRWNVALFDDGVSMDLPPRVADYDRIFLHQGTGETGEARKDRLLADPTAAWIATQPEPKVAIRLDRGIQVTPGEHRAVPPEGVRLKGRRPPDLLIAHLPFSTVTRFERKLDNMRRIFREVGHLIGPDVAWHWRRWLAVPEGRAGAEAELARNTVPRADLERLLHDGLLRSVAGTFAAR
jgi:hypothetical protein